VAVAAIISRQPVSMAPASSHSLLAGEKPARSASRCLAQRSTFRPSPSCQTIAGNSGGRDRSEKVAR
jgi:hypothetical protein